MKNLCRIIALLLAIVTAFMVISCENEKPTDDSINKRPGKDTDVDTSVNEFISDPTERCYKGNTAYVYDGYLYAYVRPQGEIIAILNKYNLNDAGSVEELTGVPVCSDVLCEHNDEDCPLYAKALPYYIAIDEYETEKNGGAPIIYVASNSQIFLYNSAKTNRE